MCLRCLILNSSLLVGCCGLRGSFALHVVFVAFVFVCLMLVSLFSGFNSVVLLCILGDLFELLVLFICCFWFLFDDLLIVIVLF